MQLTPALSKLLPAAPENLDMELPEQRQMFSHVELYIPDEVAQKIFQRVPFGDIPKVCETCKSWRLVASDEDFWTGYDIRALLPGVKIIDEAVWQRRVPIKILEQLKFASGFRPALTRSVFRDIRLLKIPGDKISILVFPAGFSYQMLQVINIDKKLGPLVNLWFSLSKDNKDWDDHPRNGFIYQKTKKAHAIAITNEILSGSEQLSVKDKISLVKSRALGILDVATLHTLTLREKFPAPVPPECGCAAIYPIRTMCVEAMSPAADGNASIGTNGNTCMSFSAHKEDCGVGAKWVLKNVEI